MVAVSFERRACLFLLRRLISLSSSVTDNLLSKSLIFSSASGKSFSSPAISSSITVSIAKRVEVFMVSLLNWHPEKIRAQNNTAPTFLIFLKTIIILRRLVLLVLVVSSLSFFDTSLKSSKSSLCNFCRCISKILCKNLSLLSSFLKLFLCLIIYN